MSKAIGMIEFKTTATGITAADAMVKTSEVEIVEAQIEFKTTATGITAADAMVKTSEVEIVEAQTVCPGKYIAIN